MIFYGKRMLFIGAHPDDIELGAGALIHHIQPHCDVLCVTLSDNQKNPNLKNVVEELYASMAILGVPRDRVIVEQFITREFPAARQEILEYLLKLRREFKPEIVFTHSQADIHQDHNVVTDEALRAYRGTTVLGFGPGDDSVVHTVEERLPLDELLESAAGYVSLILNG